VRLSTHGYLTPDSIMPFFFHDFLAFLRDLAVLKDRATI